MSNVSVARPRVLVVDDEPNIRSQFRILLENEYEVLEAGDADAGLALLENERVDLVMLDQMLPGKSGLEVLEAMRRKGEETKVIMVSALNDTSLAVKAIKAGAEDYVIKGGDPQEFLYRVRKAIARRLSDRKLAWLESELSAYRKVDWVSSRNARMLEIDQTIRQVAALPTTILVLGESGTGKEGVAHQVFAAGGDHDRPFVTVNMAAIPSELAESILFGHERGAFTGAVRLQYGKFEMASGGTLFMDEVGDLPLDLQSKLLRVIQEGEFERVGGMKTLRVNVRLVAATNRDLRTLVEQGAFRDDLYYRLNVVPIVMPPLRERSEDIPALAAAFVAKFARLFGRPVRGLSPEAIAVLCRYKWPGNIRELENLMERLVAVSVSEIIEHSDIPVEFLVDSSDLTAGKLDEACRNFEREFIKRAMQQFGGHRLKTADYLGIPLSTLKYKMTKLELYSRTPFPGKEKEKTPA